MDDFPFIPGGISTPIEMRDVYAWKFKSIPELRWEDAGVLLFRPVS